MRVWATRLVGIRPGCTDLVAVLATKDRFGGPALLAQMTKIRPNTRVQSAFGAGHPRAPVDGSCSALRSSWWE
jgi:hypothetical protein